MVNLKSKYFVLAISLLLAFSFTLSIVPIAHASLSAPVISPSTGTLTAGQTLTLTVSWSGGVGPFSTTIYKSPVSFCSVAQPVFAGPMVGPSPAVFPGLVIDSANPYYCASVLDGGSGALTTSGVAHYSFVSSIAASVGISPAAATIDAGQTITLISSVSGGQAPYTYAWYTAAACAGLPIGGATSSTYVTGVAGTYSVKVTDSTVGTPANSGCGSPSVITVSAAFSAGIVSFSANPTDVGNPITASVSWVGGTAPFSVKFFSGTSGTCSSDTTVVASATGVGGSPKLFAITAPAAPGLDYCATITDSSAGTPPPSSTVTDPAVFLATSPAIGGVAITFPASGATVELGYAGPFNVQVSWASGTGPFTVTTKTGSNSACSSDPIPSASDVGVVGSPHLMSAPLVAPASNTYFCATVSDSVGGSSSMTTAALFQYVAALSVGAPSLTPGTLDSGQSATVTAKVSFSGGIGPFIVTLHADPGVCSSASPVQAVFPGFNPLTGVAASPVSFTFASPLATTNYCATVVDSFPVTVTGGSTALTINPALVSGLLTLVPAAGIDQGQTTSVTGTVNWAGGTPNFSVKLFSGTSGSCSSDTTPVTITGGSGWAGSPATITFTSATATTQYCAVVTDSSGVPASVTDGPATFTVNPPLAVALAGASISAGQSATLTAIPSGGTPAYAFQWYSGSGCVAANILAGQTAATYMTGVLTATASYSVLVTDSSPGTPAASVCKSATVTVGNGPTGIATNFNAGVTNQVFVANWHLGSISVIDSISNIVVVPSIPTGTGTVDVTHPWGIAVSPATAGYPDGLVYVTNYGENSVTVIDPATNGVVTTIALGAGTSPKGIAVNNCFKLVYVAESSANAVAIIDADATHGGTFNTVLVHPGYPVPTGAGPQGVAVLNTYPSCPSATNTVFVTDYASNTVSALQVRPDSSPFPYLDYGVTIVPVQNSPWGVAVNPSTNLVYVTNSGSGSLSVFNGLTYASVKTVTLGGTPEGITLNTASSTAYIANAGLNVAQTVNLGTYAVSAIPIPGGSLPSQIALLASGADAYMTNSGSNIVSVIDTTANAVVDTIVVP